MNVIDEWLNSDDVKRDALKFKNGCYIISGMRCGKTKMMNDLFERLGIDIQKTPKIRYLRQKFDDVDATNAIKEFINKQYGTNSFGRAVSDDSLDALRYVCPTIEQIREEFMMELLYEGHVMAIDRGFGNDVIDMYVRVFTNRNDRNNVKFNFYRRSSMDPIYTVKFTNPTWDENDICDTCNAATNDKLVWQLYVRNNREFLAACERKYDVFVDRSSVGQKELYRGEVRAEYRYGRYCTYCGPNNIDAIFYATNDGVKFRFEYNPLPGSDEAKEATTIFIPKEEFERKSLGEFMKDSWVQSDSLYEYIIKKVEEVSNFNLKIKHLNCGLVTHNFFMGAIRAYNAHLLSMTKTANKPAHKKLRGKFINYNGTSAYYCITDYYLDPVYQEDEKRTRARLHAYKKPANHTMEFWGRAVVRYSKEHIEEVYGIDESTLVYYVYDDGRIEIPCYEFVEDNDYPNKAKLITDRINPDTMDISKEMEMLKNYKKEEETKEMDINILKGAFNSKLYMVKNGSEDLSYLGTVMNMQIDRALGCELTGKIDFITDDEPVKKLQYFNREFIKNVVFNDPATIVEWKDGTKTVVQARDGEKFDPEKGLAMAISKKAMGNKRDYYHVFKHYLKKVTTESVFGENTKVVVVPAEIADDVMKYIADTFCEKEAEKSAKKKDLKEIVKSLPDELYYDNQAIDLKDFKVDSENDLVTFKCSKADAERIKGFITRSDDSNSVHITPETIEEVKRVDNIDGDGPLMPL